MAIEVEIINEMLKFTREETFLTYLLAFSTFTLAIITGLSLWRTQKHTQSQLKQSRDEFKHKTRPILARFVHKKRVQNFQFAGDTYILTIEKVMFHFKNNGTTSATNVRKSVWLDIHDYGFDEPHLDPQKESEYETEKMSDLAPTEYYSVDIHWNIDYNDEAWEGKNCYFALLIWYDDDEKNEYYYHMECHFDRKMLMLDYVRTGTLNKKNSKKI